MRPRSNLTQRAKNNKPTIADAKKGEEAIQGSMKVLAEFYAKASDATAMLQEKELPGDHAQKKAGQPETSDDTPYRGRGADSAARRA